MKITLNDPLGRSIEIDASASDVMALKSIVPFYLISDEMDTDSEIFFVKDVWTLMSDFISARRSHG